MSNTALQNSDEKRRSTSRYRTLVRQNSARYAIIQRARQTPVLINYNIAGRRYDKRPDAFDLDLVRRIEAIAIPYWFPTVRIDQDIDIWYERDYRSMGIYAIHHFYTQRNLYVLSAIWHRTSTAPSDVRKPLQFVFTGALQIASRTSSFRFDSRNPQNTGGGIVKGSALCAFPIQGRTSN